LQTIVDVLAEVDRSYYRKLSEDERQAMVEAMIQAGLNHLDPYSQYFNEKELKQFTAENRGVFGGIGAMLGVDPRTGTITIDNVLPESPALAGGLLAKDLILKVDGVATNPNNVETVRAVIKGEPGTAVTLTIGRAEATFDVVLTRAIIQIQTLKGYRHTAPTAKAWDYLIDPQAGIAYIRLLEFNEKAAAEMQAALKEIDAAGGRALILDLRDNGGGLLNMAEQIADLFLAEGVIVRTQDRAQLEKKVSAKNDSSPWELPSKRPMVVLLNRNSASATEIVAAALQDNNRATIIGERSYGKGSVQRNIVAADDKSAIKITTQIWLTPKGRHIDRGVILTDSEAKDITRDKDAYGVKPDAGFDVPLTNEQIYQIILHQREVDMGREPTTAKAIEAKPGEKGKGNMPPLDPTFRDPVVRRAIDELSKQVGQAALGQRPKAS